MVGSEASALAVRMGC
uniref:Uncharacterized protein n=1 Tax=Arundo donax TaxID=35708 RepID=A0A0A9FR45_ARUDO